jgi:hypothetical protein
MNPGLHLGIPMATYLAMPAVSASGVRRMVDACPAAAWWDSWLNPKREDSSSDETQSIGVAAHAVLLEGSMSRAVELIDPAKYPAKNGNIPEGWTNPAIRAARDEAAARGKVALLPAAHAKVEAMVIEARSFIGTLRETEPAIWRAFQPDGGDSEATLLWDARGLPCRARADRISKDRRLIVDVKTCGSTAEPDAWGRTQLVGMGYYVSAAFYRRAVEALFDVVPDYVFLVQEQEAPFLCSLVGVDPQGLELGASKVRRGMDMWRSCLASDRWPAYPNRVCYPEMPPWERARWESGQGGEQAAGIPYDPAKLYAGIFERRAA